MILCYSGTGNSRYIANRIALETQDTIFDLNDAIKKCGRTEVQTGADVIVVVPTYAWRLPKIVVKWISETNLKGAERIWFVMDCGDGIGNAAKYNERLAQKKGLCYMGTFRIIMPENYIAVFNAPDEDKAVRIVKKAESAILRASSLIKASMPFATRKSNLSGRILSGIVNPIFYRFIVKSSAFRVGSNCTGCGLCAKKCPLNNIHIEDNKPLWGRECTHCMACICYCPVKAIEYKKKSIGKPRYHIELIEKRLDGTKS